MPQNRSKNCIWWVRPYARANKVGIPWYRGYDSNGDKETDSIDIEFGREWAVKESEGRSWRDGVYQMSADPRNRSVNFCTILSCNIHERIVKSHCAIQLLTRPWSWYHVVAKGINERLRAMQSAQMRAT